jgi:cation diffusion facilitator family transporter
MKDELATDPLGESAARARGIRFVLWGTFLLNVAVAIGKIAAGIAFGSLAIRADGLHSSTDALNNIVLLVGLWLGAAPADREHPYGHRKLEVIAAMIVGAGLLLVSFDLIKELIARARGHSPPPELDAIAFVVLGVTLAINIGVAMWEASAAKRYMSPALGSDAAHTKSDIIVTVGVIVSAALTAVGYVWLDAVAGAAVAVVIAVAGVRIVRENANYLLDANLVDDVKVDTVARGVEGVRGVRAVRSRGLPNGMWLDLAIIVDGGMTVEDGHQLAHRVEDELRAKLPGVVGVQIHVEPVEPRTS